MQENKHWFLSLKKASLQVQPQQSKQRAEVKMTVFFFLEVSLLDTHNSLSRRELLVYVSTHFLEELVQKSQGILHLSLDWDWQIQLVLPRKPHCGGKILDLFPALP